MYFLDLVIITKTELIIDFIQKIVENGIELPAYIFRAFESEINNLRVLKIFFTVSNNNQLITEHLLNIFIQIFNPNEDNITKKYYLLKIFENTIKNNQKIEQKLIPKLEKALDKKDLESYLLPIFIRLIQKGKQLSNSVNNIILDKLLMEKEFVIKKDLLSSLGSFIQTNRENIKLYSLKINNILTNEITSNVYGIQKICVGLIAKLTHVTNKIDNNLLDKLVQIGTSEKNSKIIHEIQKLFEYDFLYEYNSSMIEKKKEISLENYCTDSPVIFI